MTREKARELLPVIQAYAEGKAVQYECGGHWVDELAGDVSFTDHETRWRVKPEPREWWLVGSREIKSMPYGVWSSKPDYSDATHEIIHVREVL